MTSPRGWPTTCPGRFRAASSIGCVRRSGHGRARRSPPAAPAGGENTSPPSTPQRSSASAGSSSSTWVMSTTLTGEQPSPPLPATLPRMIATSVVRATNQGESHGGVYLVDLLGGSFEQVIDWNEASISWEGRGADRGLRGIAFHEDLVLLAASDEIFVYDTELRLVGSHRNRYLKHCHEIAVDGDHLLHDVDGFRLDPRPRPGKRALQRKVTACVSAGGTALPNGRATDRSRRTGSSTPRPRAVPSRRTRRTSTVSLSATESHTPAEPRSAVCSRFETAGSKPCCHAVSHAQRAPVRRRSAPQPHRKRQDLPHREGRHDARIARRSPGIPPSR